MSQANSKRRQEQFWETANLVVEIISPDDPDRDLVDKRRDYAVAGIAEYWMIDSRNDSIQVLHLRDGEDREVIRAGRSEHAVSRVLQGFRMNVEELFAKARAQQAEPEPSEVPVRKKSFLPELGHDASYTSRGQK